MKGCNLSFEYFSGMVKKGKLSFENNKYWLPSCGGVNAETVRIKLTFWQTIKLFIKSCF